MNKKISSGSVFRKKFKGRDGKMHLGETWYLQYYVPGQKKPIRISAYTTDEQEAINLLRQKVAKAANHTAHTNDVDQVRISQLLDLVIGDYKYHSHNSSYDTELRINAHLRPFFGNVKACAFGTTLLRRYVAGRKQKVEQSTLNKELAWLRRAFRLGYEHEPRLVDAVPHIPIPKVDNEREGVLPHESYRAVRDLLPSYARIAFVIAYHTGARKGEIRSIRPDAISFEESRILIRKPTTKNKTARYLPIYGDMGPELEMAISLCDAKCPFLIQEDGHPVFEWRKSWGTACKAAKVSGTLFHDLRRTALTNMIEAGFSEKEAMDISGHKTRHVFDRYHIVSAKRQKQQAERLAQHLAAKDRELSKQKPSVN